MLALFNIGIEQNNIDWKILHEKALSCAKEDFYLHQPVDPLISHAWNVPNGRISSLMKETHFFVPDIITGSPVRNKPGYFITPHAISYASNMGNFCYVKLSRDKNRVWIGYSGRRHGINLSRVIDKDLIRIITRMSPKKYITEEPEWQWHQTFDDVLLLTTGHDIDYWKGLELSKRAKLLTRYPLSLRMKNKLLSIA